MRNLKENVFPKENRDNPDILLINVPSSIDDGSTDRQDGNTPPFGLLRIALAAEMHEIRPAVLDLNFHRMTTAQLLELIQELQPKSVGINPTSLNVQTSYSVANEIKKQDIPILVGGVHPTLDPYQAMNDFPFAHSVVCGPGELPVAKIVGDLTGNSVLGDIKGIYKTGQNNPSKRVIADRFLGITNPIPQERYIEQPIYEFYADLPKGRTKMKEVKMFISDGCPFGCSFCATPVLVGRGTGRKPYNHPGMDYLIKSIEHAKSMGANAAQFLDDMAITFPNQIQALLDWSLTQSDQFYWRGMTRASIVQRKCSDHDLENLRDSGCWKLAMGVESGNDKILRDVKGTSREEIKSAFIRLSKAGISQLKGFFIMGFPGETYQQMRETADFIMELKQLGMTHISLFQFKPYPGTELFSRLITNNPEIEKRVRESSRIKQSEVSTSPIEMQRNLFSDQYLPDDIKISELPSGKVRELIESTLKRFYSK